LLKRPFFDENSICTNESGYDKKTRMKIDIIKTGGIKIYRKQILRDIDPSTLQRE